ncbi:type IV toxin-antitoxin system AbiEi family antitoxin domain-containing protein [Gordonia sp. (in: high G+C Gram-positive bacteria)]|uniref:type IV toxin-antitoxin system AbiEi family antitoxin domain-containing protein n=2 Tax=Gordonia sp. (in: high G+C Gram-positive bacteria) TaxID=84139 RepID=UPI003C7105DD
MEPIRLGPRLICMGDSGVFTYRQLVALGYDERSIRRGVASGDLEPLRRTWYAFRMHDPEVAAAVRAGGVLGCVSALKWHGLWVAPGYRDRHVRRSKAKRGAGLPGCSSPIGRPPAAVEAVDPVPYALACAARCMTAEAWIAACDSYLNSSDTGVEELRALMAPYGGALTNSLLEKVDGRSQSGTESIVRVRLRSLGFDVVVQPAIDGVGWADLRIGTLLLECDGRQFHTSREQFGKDRIRDRKSVVDGWTCMRVTLDHILWGWDDFLEDIRKFTRAGRHRPRSRRAREIVERSERLSRGY